MTERILSELQKEYRDFFLGKLKLYGVNSPAELRTKENKSRFFTEIKQDWAKVKLAKKQKKEAEKKQIQTTTTEKEIPTVKKTTTETVAQNFKKSTYQDTESKNYGKRQEYQQPTHQEFSKQVIKSEPNKEQTDDLKILFTPNNHFEQTEQYLYPVVKMPKQNSNLKLPRLGRSNQKGYKETDFYNQIKSKITDINIDNNVHMVIPNYNKPYEPDIVLFDKKLNLYIDIEIDEPYDGYYRFPTHYTNPEEEIKQDNIRDLFFTESGWVVIRFSEKQVHCEAHECIGYIQNVLNSIYNRNFTTDAKCEREKQWDYNQCIQWQKIYYREKYLGIERFNKQYSYKEIEINTEETESIETVLHRTKRFQFDTFNSSIAFDEETHKYIHPKDETGNAEYISVTTLIERFFPFDLKRYIEKKATDEDRTEEDVLIEYLMIRDEAAEKGTFLHNQIENFLKGNEFDSDSKEFEMFLNFYDKEIKKRNIEFFDAEKMIYSDKYNVAGTIDCLFKKNDKNEYIMLDWKRSKKLIIDGRPRIFGFGYALSELSNLDNSSYYRYCLQQNIYKHIVENEFLIKISSMKLVVLHENYVDYHVVNVPEMTKETKIILNSLKHKI
ncbi:hypothetical protein [Pedobacter sp.]